MTTTAVEPAAEQITPAAGIRFVVASRPQRRFSNTQTVSNLNGPTSLAPISLPATGHVRKISILFEANFACGSAGAVVAGDAPWNLISGITLTDATGQPILQPVSGYNLYLINKYLPAGVGQFPQGTNNPHLGPEFTYSASANGGTAVFRLDIELEQDSKSGYGCIPNLDSNASLQLKIDVAPYTVAFSGTSVSAASVSATVDQWYYAPIGSTVGGQPVQQTPPGFGDFLETRYENQSATPQSENTLPLTNRGGLVKGVIAVSRAAGVRTAFTPKTNVGLVYDNNAIDEGIRVETQNDWLRRAYGYMGADLATSYAPLTPGVMPGLDRGVLVWNFDAQSEDRSNWLSTRVGTLLQVKATPGANATQMEFVTQLMQVRDAGAFYGE